PMLSVTTPRPHRSTLFPYTTLFRSEKGLDASTWRPLKKPFASTWRHLFLAAGSPEKNKKREKVRRLLARSAQLEMNIQEKKSCLDRKSTRLNSSHVKISYAVFCLKK